MAAREQELTFDLIHRLNGLTADRYRTDEILRARMKSYELAYRMQTSIPEAIGFDQETEETQNLYGLDDKVTRPFGMQLLAARRLTERGVRFIQIMHGNGAAGAWDAHSGLKANHEKLSKQVDRPIAGLLKDLKRRGLLEETIVVFATEFGRTPGSQGSNGRGSSPVRVLDLDGGWRHQGWNRSRGDRRDRLPCRGTSSLRHRCARHDSASAGTGSPDDAGAGPQAAGNGLRRADPRDPCLICDRSCQHGFFAQVLQNRSGHPDRRTYRQEDPGACRRDGRLSPNA